MNDKRWHARVIYRAEHGPVDVQHDIEELVELHGIVERGPDWNTIIRIEVTLARVLRPGMTVDVP